jgi:hypothetical protein
MHEPIAIADVEGMRDVDGEVVHRLRVDGNSDGLDRASAAVQRYDLDVCLQR